uniref:FA complementation group B n=1 Tax=Cyprinodon variegatus TaxID=28743 RepID=A0A3Q2D4X9_CYPVA
MAAKLANYGKIILFTCNQDPACNGSERNWLNFRSFSFAREVNAFLKATEGTAAISRKLSAHVDIVTCNCAVDVQRRVKTPFVLVTKKSEKGGSFQYSLLSLNGLDRLEPCIEFKLPYQMQGNVRILQGPTVLWSHDQSVFYTSPNAKGVRMIPIQMSKLFEGSSILPHPYICITQCMQVLTADRVDDVLRCVVIAATSHQQLVLFENGLVKETCELPFEQAEDIQIVNTGRNGCLFVVFFKQGHVCSVWKDTFQVASCWSDVGSVHVDDFFRCGTEQMLLLFKNQSLAKEPLENFLLTDLCGISYSCGQGFEGMKTSLPPQESSLLTLRALESRLQSGLIVLQELESELRVKDRVLQQSIQVLTATLSGRETFLSVILVHSSTQAVFKS